MGKRQQKNKKPEKKKKKKEPMRLEWLYLAFSSLSHRIKEYITTLQENFNQQKKTQKQKKTSCCVFFPETRLISL